MALINCPACNAEISDVAKICVKCGHPIHDQGANISDSPNATNSKTKAEKIRLKRGWLKYFALWLVAIIMIITGTANADNGGKALIFLSLIPMGFASRRKFICPNCENEAQTNAIFRNTIKCKKCKTRHLIEWV